MRWLQFVEEINRPFLNTTEDKIIKRYDVYFHERKESFQAESD